MTSLESALQDAQNRYEEGVISAKAEYDRSVAKMNLAQENYDTAIKKAEEEVDSLENDRDDADEQKQKSAEYISSQRMEITF